MEKYNENNASEMLTKLMDNELDPSDKKKIMDQLKSNEDLKLEKEAHQKIRDAIQKDEDSFKPPIAATTTVFGTLGMKYPIEAAGTSLLINTFLKKNWVAISLSVIAIISSFIYFDQSSDSENIANNVVKVDPKESKNVSSNEPKSDIDNGNAKIDKSIVSASSVEKTEFSAKTTQQNVTKNNNQIDLVSNYSKSRNLIDSNKDIVSNSSSNDNNANNNLVNSSKENSRFIGISPSVSESLNLNSNISVNSLITVPFQKYTYYTDVHKESIFNLGISGFNNQTTANNGLGGELSLNISRISPEFSAYVSRLNLGVLSENITNSLGQSDFGNTRLSLTARVNPELAIINQLNTNFGRPIIEIGIGNYQEILPVFSVGYGIRTFFNSEIEIKYTQFGNGMIGVGFNKSF